MSELRRPWCSEHKLSAQALSHDSRRLVGAIGAIAIHLFAVIALVRTAPMLALLSPPKESVITLTLSNEVQRGELRPPAISVSDIDQALRAKLPVVESKALSTSEIAFAQNPPESGAKQRAASSPTPAERAATDIDEQSESLLSKLRANWLPPPNLSSRVRCRLRISYRQGGVVTAVATAPSCTDQQLSTSIERAVWKSQPFPMLPRNQSYIDLEFTP